MKKRTGEAKDMSIGVRTPEAAMAECAMQAAAVYLAHHSLTADLGALTECLRAHLRIVLPGALKDAKVAMDAGMPTIALKTFEASLALAGIEAAKEAGTLMVTRREAC